MRVHHIISNYSAFSGGAQRIVRELHCGLKQREVDSHILGLTEQRDTDLEGTQSLALPSPYRLGALDGMRRYIRDRVKPHDILHVHLFPPLFYVSLLSMIGQVPCHVVCTEHSTSNRRRGNRLGRLVDTITYRGYSRVIAISEGVAEELVKWKPELESRMRVIYNGATMPFEIPLSRKSKPVHVLLSVGNLRVAKNYDNVLRALALLDGIEFEYRIAGTGQEHDFLVQLCRQLGLGSQVRFLGYVEDVAAELRAADIFLMPSRWEGFGVAAVEAMNATLPLVASDVSGLREIVSGPAPSAVLVEPGSPESIAEGIRELMTSPEKRRQLGENGFRRAQEFTVERMVDKHLALYQELQ